MDRVVWLTTVRKGCLNGFLSYWESRQPTPASGTFTTPQQYLALSNLESECAASRKDPGRTLN
eukprot:1151195-Pelagomonas_calceolata.AAC.8